jgi:hypothetical protein
VPPQQCPECGRFLKQALVVSLADAPAACPRCKVQLVAAMFEVPAVPETPEPLADAPATVLASDPDTEVTIEVTAELADPADAPSAATERAAEDAPSVRPPDLAPDAVRGEVDVLAGWDVGADADEIASWREDRRPFPTDTVLVLGAGVVGGAIAAAVAGDRRLRAAATGAVLGVLGGAITRRIWRLTP